MALKNFNTIGDLQGYEYIRGFITAINYVDDNDIGKKANTCTVQIKTSGSAKDEIQTQTIEDVPFFYHCNKNTDKYEENTEDDRGGIKDGAFGFRLYDEVVILKQRPGKWNDNDLNEKESENKIFVIGHSDGPKKCGFPVIITTESQTEAIVWDVIADDVFIEKDSYSNVINSLSDKGYDGTPIKSEVTKNDVEIYNPNFFYADPWPGDPSLNIHEYFDGMLNLPVFFHGYAPDDTMDRVQVCPYFSYLNKDEDGNDTWQGNPITGYWYRYYWAELPDFLKDIVTDDWEKKKASYLLVYFGTAEAKHPDNQAVIDEFESLTGVEWPVPDHSTITPERQYLYLKSIFDFELWDYDDPETGEEKPGFLATITNMNSRLIKMFDNWSDCEWWYDEDNKLQVSTSDAWLEYGFAKTDAGNVCHEFCAVCSDVESETDLCSDYKDADDPAVTDGRHREKFRLWVNPLKFLSGKEHQIFDAVNLLRTNAGLKPLQVNVCCQIAAERHCYDMANKMFLGHTGSDGSTPQDRMEESGYSMYLHPVTHKWAGAENTEQASANKTIDEVVAGWISSPDHIANILYEDFRETGIAIKRGWDNWIYYCQVFAYNNFVWPGFSPRSTTKLRKYMNDNFLFDQEEDYSRVPKIYILN